MARGAGTTRKYMSNSFTEQVMIIWAALKHTEALKQIKITQNS